MTELPAAVPLYEKFAMLVEALDAEHFERDREVRCAVLALVSGTTFLMVGPPGLAKSQLVRRLAARVSGMEMFDLDLDKFTTPDDLFGPRSLQAMKQDRWVRAVEGTLVTAHVALLDEFFEASSALLKSLLRALNERTFRQGTEVVPMTLTTVFAATNQLPSDPRLAALYDRLLIRCQVQRMVDTSSFLAMLVSERDVKPEPVVSWAEVELAREQACRLGVPDVVLAAVGDVRRKLAAEGMEPSDRRFAESLKVVRAAAWLDGSEAAEPGHLACLADILWERPEQRAVVARVVDQVLQPLVSEAELLLRDVRDIHGQVRPVKEKTKRKELSVELADKLTLVSRQVEALSSQGAGNARQKATLAKARAEVRATSRAIMRDLYDMDTSVLEGGDG